MHEREPGEQEAAPAVPERPLAVAQPTGILRLQSTIGNRATARLIAREDWESSVDAPKSAVLASFDAIETTYVAWHKLKARSLGVRLNDPKAMAAAAAATKTQVGQLNYERWLKQRGGLFLVGVTIGPIEYKDKATEDAEKPKEEPHWTPEGRLKNYESLKARALKLNKGVVAVEYHVHKLKTPEGAKGYAYQYGQAGFAAMYGVGARTLGTVRDKVNPMQQASEMGWKLVFSKEKGVWEKVWSSTAGKQWDDVKKYGSEMANTTTTSYEIASGQLHELYLQTRPSYNQFQSALSTFYGDTGTSAFNRGTGMMEELEALGVMTGAVAQMETSAAEYANIVQTLGVIEKAGNIDKMSKGIEGGMVNSVEIAVDMLAGAMIGGSVSPLGAGPGKLVLDAGIPGKGVIEPLLEVGKAGAKEATAPD
jgi:hypothetical protein